MTEIRMVGIVGAGALGLMYARQMADRLGGDSVIILADSGRIARYEREGLAANGRLCHFRFGPTDAPTGEKVDLLLFCTKYTGLRQAAGMVGPYVHDETILLSVLNGIASEGVLEAQFGGEHLLYCEVHGMDATKLGGAVTYTRVGSVVVGDRENRMTRDVELVRDLLARAEINCQVPEDIHRQLWSKLMLNAGVNQVTAIYGMGYGGVQRPGPARDLTILVMEETRKIAALEGVELTRADIEEWMDILDRLSPTGKTSLCQDIEAGRPTEVELFAGTVCSLGKKHGVPTPLNDFLYRRIRELEGKKPEIAG